MNCSRGKKHGETQWVRDHWKAIDARRGAWKHNKGSVVIRWQQDEKYRNLQQAHGWTETCCRYLYHLTTSDISYTAPWHQRHRYENSITLVCNDTHRQAGPMSTKRFQTLRTSLRQEEGRQNSFIPGRTREQGKDHSMKHCEQNWSG